MATFRHVHKSNTLTLGHSDRLGSPSKPAGLRKCNLNTANKNTPVTFHSNNCNKAYRTTRLAVSASQAGEINREVLSPSERMKLNATDDRMFYMIPRLVTHVDSSFLGQLTELYRERIPENAAVLDLMSSWVSHLPQDTQYSKVVGHGMNAIELSKNPQLTEFFVRDLNASPGLAAEDQSFDAVICCVSVQYLQYPEKVFAEIYRVLKPGGVCIMSFSNRLFYEKAVSAWRDGTGYSRTQLVKQYFSCVRGFTEPEVVTEVGVTPDNSILGKFRKLFERSSGDPLYAVISYRNFKMENE